MQKIIYGILFPIFFMTMCLLFSFPSLAIHEDDEKKAILQDGLYAFEDQEHMENANKATDNLNQILLLASDTASCLYEGFSGAYLKRDGTLTVMLSKNQNQCISEIEKIVDISEIHFIDGKGSYAESMKSLQIINDRISALYDIYSAGEMTDERLIEMMELYPAPQYDDFQNIVKIRFGITKEKLNQYKEEDATGNGSDIVVQHFNEAVETFKKYVYDTPSLVFYYDADYSVLNALSSSVMCGRGIYIALPLYNNYASLGYRAQMTINGFTYNGFVMSAHACSSDSNIFTINTNNNMDYYLGQIRSRKFNGNVDVAFLSIDNPNYIPSNTVHYSNSLGQTLQTVTLDGSIGTIVVNSYIYKSGRSTYLTSGTISSTSVSDYVSDANGVTTYISDMFKTSTQIAQSGDSGGVTFSGYGNTSGKAVGIVEASGSSGTYFIKASNILSSFGASTY